MRESVRRPTFGCRYRFSLRCCSANRGWKRATYSGLNMLGRLKPGMSLRKASVIVTTQLQTFFSAQAGTVISASTKRKIQDLHVEQKAGGGGISGLRYLYSQPLHLLMAVVGVVASDRLCQHRHATTRTGFETQPRVLGAPCAGRFRGRLVRQVLTESVLLSGIGGFAGVIVAWWSVKGLAHLLSVDPVVKVRPDPWCSASRLPFRSLPESFSHHSRNAFQQHGAAAGHRATSLPCERLSVRERANR